MDRNIGTVAITCWIFILIGAMASPSRVDARPYTQLYIFGGNWEEVGNNLASGRVPDAPYFPGRRTNGKSYVEHLAQKLGIAALKPSKDGGTNYAWGNKHGYARVAELGEKTLQMQIDEFEADLEGKPADPDALFIVVGFQSAGAVPADRTIAAILRLAGLGAAQFMSLEKIEPIVFVTDPTRVFSGNDMSMETINAVSGSAGDYNRELGNLAGTTRSNEGLSIVVISYRKWVDAAKLAGLILDVLGPPANADPNNYFNLIGLWRNFTGPSGRAHELLAGIAFEAINRRPELVEPIEDLTLSIEDEPFDVDLFITFLDPDADRLTYTVKVQVDSVLQASISGLTLTITPVADGFTRVTVIATDGINRGLTESFDVTVLPIPGTISLAVESADFGDVEIKTDSKVTLTISNTGEGPLNVTDITSDVAGVTASETEFTIPVGESHDVTLTFSPTTEGAIAGTLTILSNDAEDGTISVSLAGSAIVVPADARTDFNGDGQLNLTDFILFAQNYGSDNPDFDLSGNGRVDLADFILFVQNYTRPLQ